LGVLVPPLKCPYPPISKRRIKLQLNKDGITCSRRRVKKIMDENGIYNKYKVKFKSTTNSIFLHYCFECIIFGFYYFYEKLRYLK
jgi:hypothetical protein